jgi:hypothetical protein
MTESLRAEMRKREVIEPRKTGVKVLIRSHLEQAKAEAVIWRAARHLPGSESLASRHSCETEQVRTCIFQNWY